MYIEFKYTFNLHEEIGQSGIFPSEVMDLLCNCKDLDKVELTVTGRVDDYGFYENQPDGMETFAIVAEIFSAISFDNISFCTLRLYNIIDTEYYRYCANEGQEKAMEIYHSGLAAMADDYDEETRI